MFKIISPVVLSFRKRVRDSFTLVEILVVIAIIAILAGVALPAITGAIKKANENAALQTARGLELSCFQYANDNSQTYPGGSSSLLLFQSLTNGYLNNTDPLYINGTPGKTKATGAITAANVCWDATVISPSSGLTSADPDQTPVIMSTGSTIVYPANGSTGTAGATISATGSGNPFTTDGIAVAYKSGSAAFEHCSTPGTSFAISSPSFAPVNTYVQILP